MGAIADKIKAKLGTDKAPPKPNMPVAAEVLGSPPAATKKAKQPKDRKCCATKQKEPHLATCLHMQPTKPKKPKPMFSRFNQGRLPHGAVYHKAYDDEAKQWTATLTIPGFPQFTAQASGSWRVENDLDKMYRAAIEASAPSV